MAHIPKDMISVPTSIEILRSVSAMRNFRSALQGSVSLVPTMGMLHSGHMSLIRLAAAQTDAIIVSVYVNPTQLATAEARAAYPSVLEEDMAVLEKADKELHQLQKGRIKGVFAPTDKEMYPNMDFPDFRTGFGSHITISPLAQRLEGADQPFHFIGVATVCLKLFNIIRPYKAYFGEKDFQQTIIIKKMVEDFFVDVTIVVGETVRERDGLAVSSRNVHLGHERRRMAKVLWEALSASTKAYYAGELKGGELLTRCNNATSRVESLLKLAKLLRPVRFDILYYAISDLDTLEDVEKINPKKGALISGAIQMLPFEAESPVGSPRPIRLIDSIVLKPTAGQSMSN